MERTTPTYTLRFWASLGLGLCVGMVSYWLICFTDIAKKPPVLSLLIQGPGADEIQFFTSQNGLFNPAFSTVASYSGRGFEEVELKIPPGTTQFEQLRIDLGNTLGTWQIRGATFKSDGFEKSYSGSDFSAFFPEFAHIDSSWLEHETWHIRAHDLDAYFISNQQFKPIFQQLIQTPPVYKRALYLAIILGLGAWAWGWVRFKTIEYTAIFNMQKLYVLLIATLSLPTIHFILSTKKFENSRENRKLTEKPTIDIAAPTQIPKQLVTYYNDHFGGRDFMIFLNSYLKLKGAQTSARPDLVMIGKEGWLYATDPAIIGDYRRVNPFDKNQLRTIIHRLREMSRWCALQKIQFLVLVTPNKYTIYPEKLPSQFQFVHPKSNMDLLRETIQPSDSLLYIDVNAELIAQKKIEDIFYKNDSHWNFRGGHIGYSAIAKALQIKPHSVLDFTYTFSSTPDADLARLLALEELLRKDEILLTPRFPKKARLVEVPIYPTYAGIQPAVVTEISDTTLPRLVMFRDSYTNLMYPYLSEHFERAVYLWTHRFDPEIIQAEKPDIVVFQITEQYLYRLLYPNPSVIRYVRQPASLD